MKTSKKYDVILFDLDGTLTDPMLGITKSVQYALQSFGIKVEHLEQLKKFIGPPLKDSFMEYYHFDDQMAEEAIIKYREYFTEKGIYENLLYPKIPELLTQLKEKNKELMVATSKPTDFAKIILNHFDLKEYFSDIIGSELDGSRSRKGDVIAYALRAIEKKDYKKVVMIGDRKHDIIGAKEIGIDSIGVLYGYGSLDELKTENPTYIVNQIEDLKTLLI